METDANDHFMILGDERWTFLFLFHMRMLSTIPFYHSWPSPLWIQLHGLSFAIYGKLPDLTSVMTLVFSLPLGPPFLSYMLHVASTLDKSKACHTKSYYTTHSTIITTIFCFVFCDALSLLSSPHSILSAVIHTYQRILSFVYTRS